MSLGQGGLCTQDRPAVLCCATQLLNALSVLPWYSHVWQMFAEPGTGTAELVAQGGSTGEERGGQAQAVFEMTGTRMRESHKSVSYICLRQQHPALHINRCVS